MRSSEKAILAIMRFEGYDNPWEWPEGASGITIGRGYDLGYEAHFASDWSGHLPDAIIKRLLPAVGVQGKDAEIIAPLFKGIVIPHVAADIVFRDVTIPREERSCMATFPGSECLPGDAFGALVSLGYNRGWSLKDGSGKSRAEMRGIAAVFRRPIDKDTLDNIADLMTCMAVYWADRKDSDGDLHDRRLSEAKLIREASWPKALPA